LVDRNLPPYSLDFNPIEPMWSKVRQILRSHAPRTEEELPLAAQTAFQSISTADCTGFFLVRSAPHDIQECSKPESASGVHALLGQ
jgi:hypothetical protein